MHQHMVYLTICVSLVYIRLGSGYGGGGIIHPTKDSHLSHMQNTFTPHSTSPEVSTHYSIKSKLKVSSKYHQLKSPKSPHLHPVQVRLWV